LKSSKILFNEIINNANTPSREKEYLTFHKNRFNRFDEFLKKISVTHQRSFKVLEIGSHYLHSSVLLSSKGFHVDSMDVSEFWELDFVQLRAKKYNLNPIIENDLSRLESVSETYDKYDLIVFTEILEHITFNPISFWKRIYQILKSKGIIYITTPNAFSLPYLVRNLKNILFLKSTGITIDEIMSKVTYGHHWKEYSAPEIKKYFSFLSSDFEVEINPYQYKFHDLKPPNLVFKILSRIGNMTNVFADDLEVIVKLNKKTGWKIKSPTH
jgi:2-polyprenyl-6-hydroxyphenyl methylase/3-demethylubiquinone-9 3-methyltransferase|tara:strand:+ start:443 stop:1252 length:810 start_codon:yes stop_codon:yes gene_type:complete